jgi:hypothetical protein
LGLRDDALGRLLVITRTGELGGVLSPHSQHAVGARVSALTGDGAGYLYGEARAHARSPEGSWILGASASVIRRSADDRHAGTVAQVYRPPAGANASGILPTDGSRARMAALPSSIMISTEYGSAPLRACGVRVRQFRTPENR